jgi:hypothetical protein
VEECYSKVYGVGHRNADGTDRQKIAAKCVPGEALSLIREPNNPHDPNAIALFRRNGQQLGYVGGGLAETLAPVLDGGGYVTAVVAEVTGGERGKVSRGANLHVRLDDSPPAQSPCRYCGHADAINGCRQSR